MNRCHAVLVALMTFMLAGTLHASEVLAPRITLACGGIGEDESARMRALEKAHALTMIFALRDGTYITDVMVRIEDPLADLHIERACGPIGLVDVPVPGRYRVVARFGAHSQEHWVELRPFGGDRLVLRW
jgi:hypothetical protein